MKPYLGFIRKNIILPAVALSVIPILSAIAPALAQQADTLRVVSTLPVNVLDVASPARALQVYGVSVMTYDRLMTFRTVETGDGFQASDMGQPAGELAETWKISDDLTSITLTLRKDATFHDGTPVTANDVKWSLDRAIAVPASKAFMGTGGLTEPAQIVVIDDSTVRVDRPAPNRLTLAVLAGPLVPIINSKVALEHANAEDPWAVKWLEANVAGGGAYKIEEFRPNEQIVYRRHDGWVGGETPYFDRVVYQTVPEASSIIALMERGRADFTTDIPLKDMPAIAARGALATGSVTMRNSIDLLAMNTHDEVLSDKRVRQAVAYAVPYNSIYQSVYNSTGEMLGCGAPLPVTEARYPQAYPYCTDIEKAKALLAEAGHADGIDLTLTFETSRAATFEPTAVLLQESFAKAGIKLNIEKMVGGQFAQAQGERNIKFFGWVSNAWLGGFPDYWFRTFFSGDWHANLADFQNEELNALLVENATTFDQAAYDDQVRKMVTIAMDEMPILPLRLRTIDVVQAADLTGFTSWFHGALDLRQVRRKQ